MKDKNQSLEGPACPQKVKKSTKKKVIHRKRSLDLETFKYC